MEPHANSVGFRAIVENTLFEPGMFQRLLGCDPLLGVVYKDALKQVQEGTVEGCVAGDDILRSPKSAKLPSHGNIPFTHSQRFHRADVLP